MLELDEIELEFLDAMGIEKKGNLFFDKKGEKILLYDGNVSSHTPDKDGLPLKIGVAYVNGTSAVAFIRKYEYYDRSDGENTAKVTCIARVLRDGIWHNLEIVKRNGINGDSVILSKERNKPENKGKLIIPPIVSFNEHIKGLKEEPNDEYYFHKDENDRVSASILNEIGISVCINSARCWFECDDEVIQVGSTHENIEFSYENIIAIIKKYMNMDENANEKDFPDDIRFMLHVAIPSMLSQEIERVHNRMASCRLRDESGQCGDCDCCDEDKARLAVLEYIYKEFVKHAELSIGSADEGKHPLQKHVGEV